MHAQSLNASLAHLDATAPAFRTLTADIKRNVHTAVIDDDARDAGIIRIRREKAKPTRMLIEFTGPDAKTASLDGASLSIYYPKIKTVQIYDISGKRGLVDQFLLLGFGATAAELRDAYEVSWVGSETVGGEVAGHLRLVPKSTEVLRQLKSAELWIADSSGLPAQQKFTTSAQGDFTLVTYSNVKLNPALPENQLKLSYPKGVQIEHPGK